MTLFSSVRGPRSRSKEKWRVHPIEESQHGAQETPSTCLAESGASSDGRCRHDALKSTASETGVTPRAPDRHPSTCSSDSTGSQRPAAQMMMSHMKSMREALPTLKPGTVVTTKSARVNMLVVRNPKAWSQGDVDGGPGKPGIITAIDEVTGNCAVYWYESEQVNDCSIGRRGVLCKPCGAIPVSLGGDDGLANVGMAQTAMEAMRTLFGGRAKRGHQTETPVEPFASHISPFGRQISYADKTETAIIFDWDDTLFPTTYVKHDLGLSITRGLKDQALSPRKMLRVRAALARAACAAERLLQLADGRGKVVIVTLARSPWVTDSCKNFYPGMGELIQKLGIQIVYARDGEQVEHSEVNSMAEDQFETFWAETKGRAIFKFLSEFYSQYEGQSWKNVISVGDSHFERYGTMAATMHYAAAQGLVNEEICPGSPQTTVRACGASKGSARSTLSVSSVKRLESSGSGRRMSWEGTVGGYEIKVRTKTFRMLGDPTEEELIAQVSLLHRWLPLMVEFDDGFDVDLNSLDGEAAIEEVESTLFALKY
ncbi:unnamed protein product [Prorocentrum cordatum]|uniref:Uncharacterized protein n=1 Tax=Prorocentrum cordatum TaxID=2364126 RepID=A0ABN9VV85_9DINO|nr:unnamed protein product [Polarella glacialis]